MNLPFQTAANPEHAKTAIYAELVSNITNALNGMQKASHLMSLFKTLQQDNMSFPDMLKIYPSPELESQLIGNKPFVQMCHHPHLNLYFCPHEDYNGIKSTSKDSEAATRWLDQLGRLGASKADKILNAHCALNAPENI